MPNLAHARSLLFVPAHRPERIDKALASGADAVIVDLEDAVAPQAKGQARVALQGWLAQASPSASVVVRINGALSPWFDEDVALCRAPGVQAVMLPKAGQDCAVSHGTHRLDAQVLEEALPGKPILALVESAEGIDRLRELCRVPGVRRLALGGIDLALDLGLDLGLDSGLDSGSEGSTPRGLGAGLDAAEGDHQDPASEDPLAWCKAQLVLHSRLAQLPPPVDGVSTAIDDAGLLRRDAQRARRLGFAGKLCIHPRQVAVVQQAFSASPQERAWAQRVVAAAQAAGGAAVAVDGRMVDLPVLRRAQALMQAAG